MGAAGGVVGKPARSASLKRYDRLSVCGASGVKTVVVEGKTYSIHQDCWKWQDTYLTQTETEGTWEYMKDSPVR